MFVCISLDKRVSPRTGARNTVWVFQWYLVPELIVIKKIQTKNPCEIFTNT